jgi:CHAT domain-containing protein
MSKHDAFVLAKKSIMEKYEMPKYWGSFILIGAE